MAKKAITAEWMKRERKRHKMTQTEFAELLGVTIRTIQLYEKGAPIPESRKDSICYRLAKD